MAPGDKTNKRTHEMLDPNTNGTDSVDGAQVPATGVELPATGVELPTTGATGTESPVRQKSSSRRGKKNRNKSWRKAGSASSNGDKHSSSSNRVGDPNSDDREGSHSNTAVLKPGGLSNNSSSGPEGASSVSPGQLPTTSGSQSNPTVLVQSTPRKQTSWTNGEVHDSLKKASGNSEDQPVLVTNMDLTDTDERMVRSVSYVLNLTRDEVLGCLQALKQQHAEVTNNQLMDTLFDNRKSYVIGNTQQYPSMPKPQSLDANSGANEASGGQVNGNNTATLQSQGGARGQLSPQFQNTSQELSHQLEAETEDVENDGEPEPPSQSDPQGTEIHGLTDDDDDVDNDDCVDGFLKDHYRKIKQSFKGGKNCGRRTSNNDTEQGTSLANTTARSKKGMTRTQEGASNSQDEGATGTSSNGVRGSHVNALAKKDPAMHLAICLELAQREYKLLDKGRYCIVCETKPRDVTFLPCGHIYACKSCAEPIYTCPRCERSILATVNTYLC